MLSKLVLVVFVTGVMAAASVVVLGWDSVVTTVTALRNQAQEAVEDAKSEVQQAAEIDVRVEQLHEQIDRFADSAAVYGVTLQAWRAKVVRIQEEMDEQEDILFRARKMLRGNDDTHVIGGRQYTRQQLNDDAVARVERCEFLSAELERARQVIGELEGAVRDSQEALVQARQQQESLAARLTMLKARIDQAELQRETNALVGDLQASPTAEATKLSDAMTRLEQKLQVDERRRQADFTRPGGGSIVDWEGKRVSRDGCVAIEEWFGLTGTSTR